MTNYFVKAGSKCEDDITAAEDILAFHAVKHHQSCLCMEYTSVLLKKIFLHSNVAKKFSSGRTTTEKVVTSIVAQYSIDAVLKSFEENDFAYFGVATDGINHNELKILTRGKVACSQNLLSLQTNQTRLPTQLPFMLKTPQKKGCF